MNFSAKVMNKNVWPFRVWLGPLSLIKIQLKTAQLLSKHCSSDLSFCILYVLFHKGKDTSAVPQPSVQHLVYEHFVHLVCSHKCFNNFRLSKNILINKFFYWNMCFYLFTIHEAKELSVSLWSKIISCN